MVGGPEAMGAPPPEAAAGRRRGVGEELPAVAVVAPEMARPSTDLPRPEHSQPRQPRQQGPIHRLSNASRRAEGCRLPFSGVRGDGGALNP